MNHGNPEDAFIVEYVALGNSVKATAIDPRTLREATVIGPTSATQKELGELAVRKLHYVLLKGME